MDNKIILTFLLAISFGLQVNAQNNSPSIAIQSLAVDTTTQTITVTYDVQDLDNDPLEVTVYLSTDSGTTHLENNFLLSGDFGFPISVGNGKSITINYNGSAIHGSAGPQVWSSLKLVATDRQPVDLAPIINQIDSLQVYQDLAFISQPRHHITAPNGLSAVKDEIEATFLAANLQTERMPFSFGSVSAENIKGRKPGLVTEQDVIILDGHFDAVQQTSGADDNATAIATLLVGARALSNLHFEKSINYLGLDKEEQGLVGAIQYVTNGIAPYENIEAVINGEMLGYYDSTANSQSLPQGFNVIFPDAVDSIVASGNRGIFLFVIGNTSNSAQLSVDFDSIARFYVPSIRSLVINAPGTGTLTPDLRRSDHAAFWDAGYPALMLTDGADTRNPYYHTLGDTIGTLDMNFFLKNVKAMVANVAAMAKPISAGVALSQPFLLSDVTVSASTHLQPTRLDIFPVPSNGFVYMRFGKSISGALINITTPEGKLIYSSKMDAIAGEEYRLDLGQSLDLVHGLLLIEVVLENERIHKKLLMHPPHKH